MSRLAYNLSIITLTFTIILMMYIGYLVWFDQNPPIKYNNIPIPVTVSEDSSYILIHFDVCRYSNAPAQVTLGIIDTFVYSLPPYSASAMKKGECKQTERRIDLPSTLPNGKYYISGKSEYKVNPLAIRVVNFWTQDFIINHK